MLILMQEGGGHQVRICLYHIGMRAVNVHAVAIWMYVNEHITIPLCQGEGR